MATDSIPSVLPATDEDIQAIIATARDYIEGWFTGNAERMERALRPELVKRGLWYNSTAETWRVGNTSTAEMMVNWTREGGGKDRPANEKLFDIEVLDVFRHVATAKVSSYPFMDYLHLVKLEDRWWIINVVFERREGYIEE